MVTTAARHKVDDHFENREPALRETYDAILTASRRLGQVTEEPKKTSIHLRAGRRRSQALRCTSRRWC